MSGMIKKSLSTALLAISAVGYVATMTACSKEEPVPPVVAPAPKSADTSTPAAKASDAKSTGTTPAAAATPAK